MSRRDIIVIGASAGGFEALKTLAAGLPSDLPASIFIVWHMSPNVRGILPQVLNRSRTLYASHAFDREPIEPGRIYVAPPDYHLLLENSHVLVTRGPKENRFRPAIDPLFRSAAYHYGPRVIGIVLSGALDDGTSGLWTVKQRGGVAVVQNPSDAEVPSMPESAMREVDVDHVVRVAELPDLLVRLTREEINETGEAVMEPDARETKKTETEIQIAAEDTALDRGVMDFGGLTPYTGPDCHGVLSAIFDGKLKRFRCHTGHAFSTDSLLTALTGNIEDSLWNAIRGVDESIILLNHMGDHFAEVNEPRLAALYFTKAKEASSRNELIRRAVFSHEQLSKDLLRREAEEMEGDDRISGSSIGDTASDRHEETSAKT
jgi:two-component system, chemotaxis family, protein-glutamate methylesterase/glutaminase